MGNASGKILNLVPDTSLDTGDHDDYNDNNDDITDSDHIPNILWSLNTLMTLIEGFIKQPRMSHHDVLFPVELIYVCAQFFGFRTLMILFHKLYTYPNMPNGLKFVKPDPQKIKKQMNWTQFKVYNASTTMNDKAFNSRQRSIFKYSKECNQSFVYIPQINCRIIPENTINTTYTTPSAIISYDLYSVRGLIFTRNGYKGYDDDVIIDGYEFEMPSIHDIKYNPSININTNPYQMRYSNVHQSLFATIRVKSKTYLYQLSLYSNEWRWECISTLSLSEGFSFAEYSGHHINFIDNDTKLFVCYSLEGFEPDHSKELFMNFNFGAKVKPIQAMIYDIESNEWKYGGKVYNEQLMHKKSNSWYNIYQNRIYVFGSRFTHNYRLYYYNLNDNQFYTYDDNALNIYKTKKHEIEQISLWNDYNNPHLLYCSIASKSQILVEFIDDRARDKGWMIDENMTDSIGEICDPSFIYPCLG